VIRRQAAELWAWRGGRRRVAVRRAGGLLTAALLGATLGLAGAAGGPAADSGPVLDDVATIWPGPHSPADPGPRLALSRAGTSSRHVWSAKATTPPVPQRLRGEVALGAADDASPAPSGRASAGAATSRAPPI